jgi:hypothetical protein
MVSKSNEVMELRKLNVELDDRNKLAQLETQRVMAKLVSSETELCAQNDRIDHLQQELSEMRRLRDDYETRIAMIQTELTRVQDIVRNYEIKDFKNTEMMKTRDQEVFNLIKKVLSLIVVFVSVICV